MRARRAPYILVLAALVAVLGARWCQAVDQEGCLLCHGLPGFGYRNEAGFRARGVASDDYALSRHAALSCRGCHRDVASVPHQGAAGIVNCGLDCHAVDAAGENPYSHESLYWTFMASAHGTSSSAALDCRGCHAADLTRESPRRTGLERVGVCGRCHLDPAAAAGPGLESGSRHDFLGDVHGRHVAAGNRGAPACPDCHTEHGVLPSGSEESSTATGHLAVTCAGGRAAVSGSCHREADTAALVGASPLPAGGAGTASRLPGLVFSLLLAGLVGARALGGLVSRS